MEVLTTALLVGQYALIGTVTASMGVGILTRGIETVQHTQSLFRGDDKKAMWQKVCDLALALIGFIGICCVTLTWAQFMGWIALGAAAPVVAFVACPSFAIVNGALAFKEFQAHQTMHALSKTCLAAASVLGGIAFLAASPPMALASFSAFVAAFFLMGFAQNFDARERAPDPVGGV